MRRDLAVRKPLEAATMVLCLVFGMYAAGCAWLLGERAPAQAPPAPQPEAAERDDRTSQTDAAMAGGPGGPGGPGDPAEPDAANPDPDPVIEPTWGYRVQLYSFTRRDLAEAAVKRVEQALAEWSYGVYLNEESESFKVRVGDFVEKADADILRNWLRNKGFVDAWTARTLIRTP